MNKELILEEIKKELEKKIDVLSFENAVEKRKEVNDFFDVIEKVHILTFESSKNAPAVETTSTTPTTATPQITTTPVQPTQTNNGFVGQLFRFERKLAGGYIPDLDGGYYLPEKLVRDMSAEEGDVVRVVSERFYYNQKQFTFEVVEKSGLGEGDRVEVRFCKVEEEAGELMVSESQQSGLILLNEVPHTFILQPRDVTKFNLKKGDILDIAYMKNHPSNQVKVIYKYETNAAIEPTLEEKKLNSEARQEKKVEEADKQKRTFPINLNLFKNKKVLVVGGENRHADYRDTFESLDIEFEAVSGNEGNKRVESAINRADIVAIVIGEASHATSIMTVKHCKDVGKPFSSTYENGIQSVLLCAEEAIQKGIQQDLIEYAV